MDQICVFASVFQHLSQSLRYSRSSRKHLLAKLTSHKPVCNMSMPCVWISFALSPNSTVSSFKLSKVFDCKKDPGNKEILRELKKKNFLEEREVWPRCWCRRLLNTSPPTDTLTARHLRPHTEQLHLKEIQKLTSDSYTMGKWENTHIKMSRKSWNTLLP